MNMIWKILVVVAAVVAGPALSSVVASAVPGLRIAGGEEAVPGLLPHQAAIRVDTSADGYRGTFCGGALLNSNVVITSATCIKGGLKFMVRLGATRIQSVWENYEDRFTARRLVHEDYQDDGANDIALIYFEPAVNFTQTIQPIRLTSEDESLDEKVPVFVSGWGRGYDWAGHTSGTLRFVESRVVTNSYCEKFYNSRIRDTNVCISGAFGKGPCFGDWGGPLIVYGTDGKPTLVGIASFGFGCRISWPSAFTRVSSYLDWIEVGVNNSTGWQQ